jgi:hypothetical protein
MIFLKGVMKGIVCVYLDFGIPVKKQLRNELHRSSIDFYDFLKRSYEGDGLNSIRWLNSISTNYYIANYYTASAPKADV